MKNFIKNIRYDLNSSLTVFLIAIPLCLGIALASGVDPIAGIISGIIGGIVVGSISSSPLSVSGPAAGLVGVVIIAIQELGSYESFLLALVIAGIFQILMGLLRMGTIANYFPTNVINGMLVAIGIIIIRKQIPHLLGYDSDQKIAYTGIDDAFTYLLGHINLVTAGAAFIGFICLAVLILWEQKFIPNFLKKIPSGLMAVLIGVIINEILVSTGSNLALSSEHLVSLPALHSSDEIISSLKFPDLSMWTNVKIYTQALTIAVIATIESLLCIEAIDKLDVLKRKTSTNRELYAQGIGNALSGLIGGLPVTSVIVRSSANLNSGARSKNSTIMHGILLLLSVLFFAQWMQKIPLAALAAVLIVVGYKLAKISIFKKMYSKGAFQFVPFLITLLAIVIFDNLLLGVGIGLAASIFSILKANLQNSYSFHKTDWHEGELIYLHLSEEVSFLNKASIKNTLNKIPNNAHLVIDASATEYIDFDVLEVIQDFKNAIISQKNIQLDLIGFKEKYNIGNTLKTDLIKEIKELTIEENLKLLKNKKI